MKNLDLLDLEIKNPKPVIIGNEEFGYLWEVWSKEEKKLSFRFFSETVFNMAGEVDLVPSDTIYKVYSEDEFSSQPLDELEEFYELLVNNSVSNMEFRNKKPVICGDIFGYVCDLCLKGQDKVLLRILVEEDDSPIFSGSTYSVKEALSRTGIDKFFKNN